MCVESLFFLSPIVETGKDGKRGQFGVDNRGMTRFGRSSFAISLFDALYLTE